MGNNIGNDGRTNAQTGCHDDQGMALAIAVQMIKAWPDSVDKETKPEDVPGTVAHLAKQIDIAERRRGRLL